MCFAHAHRVVGEVDIAVVAEELRHRDLELRKVGRGVEIASCGLVAGDEDVEWTFVDSESLMRARTIHNPLRK